MTVDEAIRIGITHDVPSPVELATAACVLAREVKRLRTEYRDLASTLYHVFGMAAITMGAKVADVPYGASGWVQRVERTLAGEPEEVEVEEPAGT